jgi:hypothetical protein
VKVKKFGAVFTVPIPYSINSEDNKNSDRLFNSQNSTISKGFAHKCFIMNIETLNSFETSHIFQTQVTKYLEINSSNLNINNLLLDSLARLSVILNVSNKQLQLI